MRCFLITINAVLVSHFCHSSQVLERSFNTGSGLVEIGCQVGDIGHAFVGVYAPNKIEVSTVVYGSML